MRGQCPTCVAVDLGGRREAVELGVAVTQSAKTELEDRLLERKQDTCPATRHSGSISPACILGAVIVRSAGADDIETLAQLRAEWRGEELTPEFSAMFREWFDRERSGRSWWLAEADGQPVGMVNVKVFERMPSPGRPPSRWGYLANLYVRPEHRGAGAGAGLLDAVVQQARADGFVRLVLAPSELSLPLYHRHGFRSADELLLLPLDDAATARR